IASLWRERQTQERRGQAGARWPYSGLGANCARLERYAHRDVGQLQAPPRSDLPALRAGALGCLCYRGDIWPACVSPPARWRGNTEIAEIAAPVSRTHPSGWGLCPGQGSTPDLPAARSWL